MANPKANSVQPKSKNVPPTPPAPGNPIHACWNPGSSLLTVGSCSSACSLSSLFALSRAGRSLHGERESNTRVFVSEVSVRRLSFVDFVWYRVWRLNLFHYLSEFRRVLQVLLVWGRTRVCIAVCVFPVLCRHFSLLFSVKLVLLLLPLRPLPDFLVPRFGGFKSFYCRRRGNLVLDDEIWRFCGHFLSHL